MAIVTTIYVHCIPSHLEHLFSSLVAISDWEKHNSHLGKCKDISLDRMAGMGASLTYFITHGLIEDSCQIECRDNEYEVSMCEEEGGCAREVVGPEEVDFPPGSNEVLE